jgi:hypothetical protein
MSAFDFDRKPGEPELLPLRDDCEGPKFPTAGRYDEDA